MIDDDVDDGWVMGGWIWCLVFSLHLIWFDLSASDF